MQIVKNMCDTLIPMIIIKNMTFWSSWDRGVQHFLSVGHTPTLDIKRGSNVAKM